MPGNRKMGNFQIYVLSLQNFFRFFVRLVLAGNVISVTGTTDSLVNNRILLFSLSGAFVIYCMQEMPRRKKDGKTFLIDGECLEKTAAKCDGHKHLLLRIRRKRYLLVSFY